MSAIALSRRLRVVIASVIVAFAAPAIAGPLTVTTHMLVEKRIAAADGTTRVQLIEPKNVVPGDRVVVVLAYRNTGSQPIADLVLANPVPKGLTYRSAAKGTPTPDVSVDGRNYGTLAALRVAMPSGAMRPAGLDDVTQVRWRLASPIAAGGRGELAFQAVLK
jgi:uncharacterized repeat protein (TIGR01451 family)